MGTNAMETFVIDKGNFFPGDVLAEMEKGRLPLCPVCRSPVHVARTAAEAKERGIPLGMQCSKDSHHFQVTFKLAPKDTR